MQLPQWVSSEWSGRSDESFVRPRQTWRPDRDRITEESGTQTSPTRPAESAFTKRCGHLKKAEKLWLISNISTDVSLLLVLNIHDQTSYTTKTELLLVWAAEISHRLQEIIQHLKSSALNLLVLLLRLTTAYSVILQVKFYVWSVLKYKL